MYGLFIMSTVYNVFKTFPQMVTPGLINPSRKTSTAKIDSPTY